MVDARDGASHASLGLSNPRTPQANSLTVYVRLKLKEFEVCFFCQSSSIADRKGCSPRA